MAQAIEDSPAPARAIVGGNAEPLAGVRAARRSNAAGRVQLDMADAIDQFATRTHA